MEIENKTIREIAIEMPAATRVFEEHKIDYCCGGYVNFKEACSNAGVNYETVKTKIAEIVSSSGDRLENGFSDHTSPSKLINFIVEEHHTYTKTEIARLTPLMEKVARKHGENHPELLELKKVFFELCDELVPHMQKEEIVLFPYIKNLEASEIADLAVQRPPFGTVQNPIRMMLAEHDAAGGLLRKIRGLTNDFTTPENACPSFKALYFGLEEHEKDLHRHIHLENNVLFPLAIEMEVKSAEVSA